MNKKAFSLIEAMIILLMISVAIMVLIPLISQKTNIQRWFKLKDIDVITYGTGSGDRVGVRGVNPYQQAGTETTEINGVSTTTEIPSTEARFVTPSLLFNYAADSSIVWSDRFTKSSGYSSILPNNNSSIIMGVSACAASVNNSIILRSTSLSGTLDNANACAANKVHIGSVYGIMENSAFNDIGIIIDSDDNDDNVNIHFKSKVDGAFIDNGNYHYYYDAISVTDTAVQFRFLQNDKKIEDVTNITSDDVTTNALSVSATSVKIGNHDNKGIPIGTNENNNPSPVLKVGVDGGGTITFNALPEDWEADNPLCVGDNVDNDYCTCVNAKGGSVAINNATLPFVTDEYNTTYCNSSMAASTSYGGTNKLWQYSDRRLKNIIGEYKKGFDAVSKIDTFIYSFKSDLKNRLHVGLIAQKIIGIFDEALSQDEKGFYSYDKSPILYSMVNSIKEIYRKQLQVEKENKKLNNEADKLIRMYE